MYIFKNDRSVLAKLSTSIENYGFNRVLDTKIIEDKPIKNIYQRYIHYTDGTVKCLNSSLTEFIELPFKVDTIINRNNELYIFKLTNGTYKAIGINKYNLFNNTETFTKDYIDLVNVTNIQFTGGNIYVFYNDNTIKYAGDYNNYGQLGNGTTEKILELTNFPYTSTEIKKIVSTSGVTYCIFKDGTVKATGSNTSGQLGVGDFVDKNVFTNVLASNVSDIITSGSTTFFILNDKTVMSVGLNDSSSYSSGETIRGILGTSSFASSAHTPAVINNLVGVNDIKFIKGTAVFFTDLKTYATGYPSDIYGVDAYASAMRIPYEITTFNNYKKIISVGYGGWFILFNDGTLKACGRNDDGCLGDGTNITKGIFTTIPLTNIKDIFTTTGYNIAFFLFNDGSVKRTGSIKAYNGYPIRLTDFSPKNVSAGNVKDIIYTNYGHIIFKTADNKILYLQEEDSNDIRYHILINRFFKIELNNIKQIAGNFLNNTNYFLMDDGTVKKLRIDHSGWYYDIVPNLINVKKISNTYKSYLFLMNDGTVKGCGNNAQGQLGIGKVSDYDKDEPLSNVNISNVKDIFMTQDTTIFLLNDNTLKLAGYDNNYRLIPTTNDTTHNYINPVAIPNITDVKQVVFDYFNLIILFNNGTASNKTKSTSSLSAVSTLGNIKKLMMNKGDDRLYILFNDNTIKYIHAYTNGIADMVISGVIDFFNTNSNSSPSFFILNNNNVVALGKNTVFSLGIDPFPEKIEEYPNLIDYPITNVNNFMYYEYREIVPETGGDIIYITEKGSVTIAGSDKLVNIILKVANSYKVTFITDPVTAMVEIVHKNNILTGNEFNLTPGTYSYQIKSPGYKTITGEVTVTDSDQTITKTMETQNYTLTFSVFPTASIVQVFYNNKWNTGLTHSLQKGRYDYKVSATDYYTQSGSIDLVDRDVNKNIALIINRATVTIANWSPTDAISTINPINILLKLNDRTSSSSPGGGSNQLVYSTIKDWYRLRVSSNQGQRYVPYIHYFNLDADTTISPIFNQENMIDWDSFNGKETFKITPRYNNIIISNDNSQILIDAWKYTTSTGYQYRTMRLLKNTTTGKYEYSELTDSSIVGNSDSTNLDVVSKNNEYFVNSVYQDTDYINRVYNRNITNIAKIPKPTGYGYRNTIKYISTNGDYFLFNYYDNMNYKLNIYKRVNADVTLFKSISVPAEIKNCSCSDDGGLIFIEYYNTKNIVEVHKFNGADYVKISTLEDKYEPLILSNSYFSVGYRYSTSSTALHYYIYNINNTTVTKCTGDSNTELEYIDADTTFMKDNIIIICGSSSYFGDYVKLTMTGTTYTLKSSSLMGYGLSAHSNIIYNRSKDIAYLYMKDLGSDLPLMSTPFNGMQSGCFIIKDPVNNLVNSSFLSSNPVILPNYILSKDLRDDQNLNGSVFIAKVSNDGNLMISMDHSGELTKLRLIDISSGSAKLIAAYN